MSFNKIVPLLFFVLCSYGAGAQFVDLADAARLEYRAVDQRQDSTFIYVFFARKGSLKAQSVDGMKADFSWFKLTVDDQGANPILENTPFYTDVGVVSSQVTNLTEGGYMVTVQQPEVVDTFWTWVFIDVIKVDSIVADNTCNFLRLNARTTYRTNYSYFDFTHVDDIQYRNIQNEFKVEWSADTDIRDGLSIPSSWENVKNSLSTVIEDPAPLRSATYTAKVTNLFGNSASNKSKLVPLITSYALFEVLRPDENGIFSSTTDLKGEALFVIRLNNKSINADKFEWLGMGDQKNNLEKDRVIWTSTTRDVVGDVTYKPGVYPIKLTVENSTTGCKSGTYSLDASGKRNDLTIDPSQFNPASIPNAFSPNGDDKNDIFTFVSGQKPVSMNQINVKIFGRNGSLVYSYSGDSRQWPGWNGKMNGSGSQCAAGVYYYIFNGVGWDDKSYSGKSYSGSLHLFLGN